MGTEARDTMEISDVRQIEFKLLEKHESIYEVQKKAAMKEEYKRKMNQQRKLLNMEQEEMIKRLEDTQKIINNLESSNESKDSKSAEAPSLTTCDYYHGPISWQDSSQLLSACEEGTFLVRDSQDPNFMYSLSFQRGKSEGPTSVRIHYSHTQAVWRLDSHQSIHAMMPSFPSIVELVQYYVNLTNTTDDYPIKLRTGLSRRTV